MERTVRDIRKQDLESLILSFANSWSAPGWAALWAFIAYSLLAFYRGTPWSLSSSPYFNLLADSFLHGQLYLRGIPPSVHDLSVYNGHYYLYWPPFPAILLVPFVALFGPRISDVLITLVISSINVGLLAALLNAGHAESLFHLSRSRRSLLVMFFCFGTVQLTLAPSGRVWFMAQEIGFMLVALTYLVAIKLRGWVAFVLAGLCMGCALATRNHLIFAGIWPAWYMLKKHWTRDYSALVGYILIGIFPIMISGALLVGYNITRFGNPLEVGITYHMMAAKFSSDYVKYGAFNVHYVPINFFYQYVSYPFFHNREAFFQGGSLFLLSPLFLAVFGAIRSHRRETSIHILMLAILLVDIPILLLMGTGWAQFGPRYTLDFTVPLLILTAIGLQRWGRNAMMFLFMISCAHYMIGYFLLKRALGA